MTNLQALENISKKDRFLNVGYGVSELIEPLKSTIDALIDYLKLDDFIGWHRYVGSPKGPFVISLRGVLHRSCEHETVSVTIENNLIIEITFVPRELFESEDLTQKIDEFLNLESENG